jgi:hypothetical protein
VRRITFWIASIGAVLAVAPVVAPGAEVVTVRQPASPASPAVAFARSSDGRSYAQVADGGLWTSRDALAWTRLGPGVGGNAIATDPTDPGSLFVFDFSTVFVSEDHGATFTRRAFPSRLCIALECGQEQTNFLFALPREGRQPRELVAFSDLDVVDSMDDGVTWETVDEDARPSTAVAAGRALVMTFPGATFRSTDGDRSSTLTGTDGGDAAAVDPGNPLHVVAVGPRISVMSEDGGRTWTTLTGRHPRELVDDVAIDPVHPLTVWAATAHALFLSRDGGSNFSRVLGTGVNPLRPLRLLGYAPPASQASRARSTLRTVLTSSGDAAGAGMARVSVRSTRPVPRSLPRVIVARWRIGARLQCVPATWTAPTRGPITWRRDGRRLGGHAVARTLGRADLHARLTCEQVAHGRAVRSLPAGPPAVTAVTSVGDFRISQTVLCRGTVVGRSPLVHVDWETGRRILPGDEHTITAADHGKVLRCRISVRNRYGNRIRFGPGHRIA